MIVRAGGLIREPIIGDRMTKCLTSFQFFLSHMTYSASDEIAALYFLWLSVKVDYHTTVCGFQTQEDSRHFARIVNAMYDEFPWAIKVPTYGRYSSSLELVNGSKIRFMLASERMLRGIQPNVVFLSDFTVESRGVKLHELLREVYPVIHPSRGQLLLGTEWLKAFL